MASLQRQHIGFALLLTGGIFLLYWKILNYPFIQDDWCVISSILRAGIPGFLQESFTGAHSQAFYRPVGQAFIAFLYGCFHLDPAGYRIVGMLLLAANALLVVRIGIRLTGEALIGWTAGFLYAMALSIHLDTLLWIVGSYDLLGAFLFFASLICFMEKRIVVSVAAYVLALLTKEATVVLPGILFLFALLVGRAEDLRTPRQKTVAAARSIIPHVMALIIYLAVWYGSSHTGFVPETDPYRMKLFGGHIVANLGLYLFWAAQAVAPFLHPPESYWLILGLAGIAGLTYSRVTRFGKPILGVLSGWFVLGILPVLFLVDHSFKYYLLYALPAALIMLVEALQAQTAKVSKRGRAPALALAVVILMNFAYSVFVFSAMEREGYRAELVAGTNNLTRKGALITAVHNFLTRRHPVLEPGTNLIFDWLPVAIFCGSSAPRIWYHDSTVTAYEIQQFTIRADSVHEVTANGRRIDPAKSIMILFHGDSLSEAVVAFRDGPPVRR